MSRKFLTHIDLVQNELQNAKVQNLATAPAAPAPVKGQLYFNSTDNTLYWYDGTVFVSARGGGTGFPGFGPVTQEQTFGATKNDGVATTTARADHQHGNPVHDNAAHSLVNLNALAAPTAPVNMGNQRLTNMATPTSPDDGTTKSYVDNLVTGLAWSDTVRAATTANITLSGTQSVDGVALVVGDRVLVKDQTTASANGVYIVQSGAWTRAADADSEAELLNMAVWVSEGTTLADTAWVCTANAPITVGTTNLPWVQFAGGGAVVGGAGLTQTGNTLNVGAGTGITVTADQVALDTTYADGRYVNTTGDVMTGNLQISATVPELRVTGAGGEVVISDGVSFYRSGVYEGRMTWDSSGNGLMISPSPTTDRLFLNSDAVVLKVDPDQPLEAATKQYVDAVGTAAALKTTILTAGAGLTGGGDLSANRTFDVVAGDTSLTVSADAVVVNTAVIATVASVTSGLALKADKTTALTAGAGLTGGGDLSTARTFDVGAGTGIVVAADTVSFDTAFGDARYAGLGSTIKRYATDVGGATSQVITHNLATLDCIVQVYRKATPFDQIECDVEHTSTNTITLRFTTAPAAAEYRVVVIA